MSDTLYRQSAHHGVTITDELRPALLASVTNIVFAAFAAYNVVLPSDAKRNSIYLTGHGGGATVGIRPVNSGAATGSGALFTTVNGSPIYLTREMVGDLITQEWEGTSSDGLEYQIITTQVP